MGGGGFSPGDNFAGGKLRDPRKPPKPPVPYAPNDCNNTTKHAPGRDPKIATHRHNIVPELCCPMPCPARLRKTCLTVGSGACGIGPGPSQAPQCPRPWWRMGLLRQKFRGGKPPPPFLPAKCHPPEEPPPPRLYFGMDHLPGPQHPMPRTWGHVWATDKDRRSPWGLQLTHTLTLTPQPQPQRSGRGGGGVPVRQECRWSVDFRCFGAGVRPVPHPLPWAPGTRAACCVLIPIPRHTSDVSAPWP